MNMYVDASYRQFLGGKPYMMPVSPWFYTNMPGFNKNWLWRGDDLWFDRWEQVMMVDPEYVQIISWNDFGESHYIGPLDEGGYGAFKRGQSPYNYAEGFDHDGVSSRASVHVKDLADVTYSGGSYYHTQSIHTKMDSQVLLERL